MTVINREINIYKKKNADKAPAVVLVGENHDAEKIMNHIDSDNYILVTVGNINWNDDLSPWYMDKLFRSDQPYNGRADKFISEMENSIIPYLEEKLKGEVSYYAIAGYSLAGLFSLYSIYKTGIFSRVASVSGSLWYPNFTEYAEKSVPVIKPEKIYFSLGEREQYTRNQLMATVKDCTVFLKDFYAGCGIETVFEENPGNHFQNAPERIAKGISWILKYI